MSEDEQIKDFQKKQHNINQERSDFLLPQIRDFLSKEKWAVLRPEYQRREVWKDSKKSLFLESLLLNIPIPNIFLYEYDYNRYEVMDGQQRLSSIIQFYENEFKLSGLKELESLNGLSYSELPELVQRGLDRRRIQATVVLAQEHEASDTRMLVFERLNTGGVPLNSHEVRNCIYKGSLNQLLHELSRNEILCNALSIPIGEETQELKDNKFYRRMEDCETVLKFFAYNDDSFKGSSKATLDDFMKVNQNADEELLTNLKSMFISSIELSKNIFGEKLFHHNSTYMKILFDGVMYASSKNLSHDKLLIENRADIISAIEEELNNETTYDELLYKVGSIASIKHRLKFFDNLFKQFV